MDFKCTFLLLLVYISAIYSFGQDEFDQYDYTGAFGES